MRLVDSASDVVAAAFRVAGAGVAASWVHFPASGFLGVDSWTLVFTVAVLNGIIVIIIDVVGL